MWSDSSFRSRHRCAAARWPSGNTGRNRKPLRVHSAAPLAFEGIASRGGSAFGRLAFMTYTSMEAPGRANPIRAMWTDTWVEPDDGVYDRVDLIGSISRWVLVPQIRKWKWRMWADHG